MTSPIYLHTLISGVPTPRKHHFRFSGAVFWDLGQLSWPCQHFSFGNVLFRGGGGGGGGVLKRVRFVRSWKCWKLWTAPYCKLIVLYSIRMSGGRQLCVHGAQTTVVLHCEGVAVNGPLSRHLWRHPIQFVKQCAPIMKTWAGGTKINHYKPAYLYRVTWIKSTHESATLKQYK